jgi:hypothetical protein
MNKTNWIEEMLELDQNTYERLQAFAKERNETIDESVNYILRQFIERFQFVTVNDFINITQEKGAAAFDKSYYIVDNNKVIATCEPVIDEDTE